ncbi:MAG: hypothetical protein GY795_26580 [Desulfobacterales bacterium]|nr:hypothetical protein [Desulfobacterales bacterium]
METKSILMILFVSTNTIISQLVLKKGLIDINAKASEHLFAFILKAVTSPFVIMGIALQAIGYIVWMLVISKVKLGIAFAISGSFFYILLALSSWMFFGEKLTSLQWVGIFIMTIGVIFMTLKI